MATIDDLGALVERAIIPVVTEGLQAFGQAAAASMAAEAPVKTGALRGSIRWELTGTLSGQWRMLAYARPIEFGHVVAYWGTTKHPERNFRKYKTGGYVDPNPFLARGARSAGAGLLTPDQLTVLRNAALAAIAALE